MKVDYERNSSSRMFDNDFLEACSRVHPAVPFVFYLPVVSAALGYALWSGLSTLPMVGVFSVLGWFTWSLMEYGLHRWLFHWEGSGPFSRRLHEITHGYHHRFPDDPLRLVMPLGASIPLAVVIGGLLFLLGRPGMSLPYFAGIVTGYLGYDLMHWSVHYRVPRTAWGKAMRAHHMAHHFAFPDQNFGISHRWLDAVVGTLKKRP